MLATKSMTMLVALAFFQCGGQEAGTVEVTPEVDRAPTGSVRAQHGGRIVSVGAHPVEVVANDGGEVRAYIRSDEPPPPERVRMTVRVPDASGEQHPVLLVWNPHEGAYVGRARRVQIAPGPIAVQMHVGRERFEATAPSYVIVAGPARPQVEVVQDIEPEDPSEVVFVDEPPPQVVVERPAPAVVVTPPSRPTVVVQRPSRPTVIVERPQPVVVVPAHRPVIVVEERHGKFKHRGRGRGHGRGHWH